MALLKPPYEWTCQRCHGSNAAHTDLCATCGFTASFTAAQLAEFNTEQMRPVGAGWPEVGFIAVIVLLGLAGSQLPSELLVWMDPRVIIVVVIGVPALIWLALEKAWKLMMRVMRGR